MLFQLFDLDVLASLRVMMGHRPWEPIVLVFAGDMEHFKKLVCSRFDNYQIPKAIITGLYGFTVYEAKSYSVVLVGRQADIDRVLADETLLWQAHLTAYPASCPQCQGALVPVTVECGGTRWNGICRKCSTVYYVINGVLFIYDLKTRSFVEAAQAEPWGESPLVAAYRSWLAQNPPPTSASPGLPSAAASEPVLPEPEPRSETWRDRPRLFW